MNDYLILGAGILLAGAGGEFFLRGLLGLAGWLRVSPRSLRELMKREFKDANEARAVLRSGYPVEEITEYARRSALDMIVIATHGRTGMKRALLGSVAERVVRHAPCPVLVVR